MDTKFEDIYSLVRDAGVNADISKINMETSFRSAGIDSLDMMSILLSIEEKYQIKIPDQDAVSLDSIAGIINYLRLLDGFVPPSPFNESIRKRDRKFYRSLATTPVIQQADASNVSSRGPQVQRAPQETGGGVE